MILVSYLSVDVLGEEKADRTKLVRVEVEYVGTVVGDMGAEYSCLWRPLPE